MTPRPMYDKAPFIPVEPDASACDVGWPAIVERLRDRVAEARRCVVAVECYPGVLTDDVGQALAEGLAPTLRVTTGEGFKRPEEIDRLLRPALTDDPVFGFLGGVQLQDYLDPHRTAAIAARVAGVGEGTVLVLGAGATLMCVPDVVVYADLPRWEIQRRQRRHQVSSLGMDDRHEQPSQLYKRGFFADWRAADRLKKRLLARVDFLLDTTDPASPNLVAGDRFRRGLALTARRPFRVVPFFDPGPWGGQWMKDVCDLPRDAPNYAWCFDCVPEENSLRLGFGHVRIEVPAIDLVFAHPRELLGDAVHGRFGAEFPIRFDFLDTMNGGNLSLQVHPLTEYIQEVFGIPYAQDESYYLLDAADDASVFLGLREGVDPAAMRDELRRAARGGPPFPAERYVNRWPARRHDHFLIPAGTVHGSGRNSMVLEISATPYLFTFKLWDWSRPGLDGLPRPIHLDHGFANIQWDRTTAWVESHLINQVSPVARGPGWCEERTGLHEREFIETRRHWFTQRVPHATGGGVNVLNLVEGAEAVVESPAGAFEPFVVHYAETFIVPAAVGAYTIRPHGPAEGSRCATIKAFVRTRP